MRMVTIADIHAAANRIRGTAVHTPLLPAPWAGAGPPVWVKVESLQPIGAFKIRGAFNAVSRLDPALRARGVVAYSSGNHAQAVAYAAARFGIPAHIVMPEETPDVKVEATRRRGADVVRCAPGQREAVAAQVVERTGGVLIAPFDDPDVIAGQGTIGVEIVADLPDVANVYVPVSGGGLASGVGTAIKALRPGAKVFGVEPQLAADTAEGLRAGRRADWPIEKRNRTVADGLRSQPSALTFAHLGRVLDAVVTVSENDIRAAVRDLALEAHLISEPSGAAALAGLRRTAPTGPCAVVLSGGNIEPALLAEILLS